MGSSWAEICPRRLLLIDFQTGEAPLYVRRRLDKDVRPACTCYKGVSPQIFHPIRVSPEEVIILASKEEVRTWARKKADGKPLDSFKQDAVDRTANQAGSEGSLITRILGGSGE